MHLCVNGYEEFTANAQGFCDMFNHWTERDMHIVLGGPTVESHSVTEIISQIAEGDDPSMQELFKGWQNGMKRRTVMALASGNAKDIGTGLKSRNNVGAVSAYLLLDR